MKMHKNKLLEEIIEKSNKFDYVKEMAREELKYLRINASLASHIITFIVGAAFSAGLFYLSQAL